MKTAIRQETVKTGRVVQRCRTWAFVQPDPVLNGTGGQEIRLFWSQLRRVEAAPGGIVFATGQNQTIHQGQKVVFVPRDGLWLWGTMAEYDEACGQLKTWTPATASFLPSVSVPKIDLDAELEALARSTNGRRAGTTTRRPDRQLVAA
ncbi:MAG: hypothetical protein Q8R17_01665 [bacterium]|nr:hypothetical protein [bacterium]